MKVKLTQEEIDSMSYDDVACLILEAYKKKMKIQELFQKVIKVMGLPEEEFTSGIADFFELLVTDKRFVMLKDGFWDLKNNHSIKPTLEDDEDDDEDDFEFIDDEDDEELDEDKEVNYDDEETVTEDDEDDGLGSLVLLDDEEDEEML